MNWPLTHNELAFWFFVFAISSVFGWMYYDIRKNEKKTKN